MDEEGSREREGEQWQNRAMASLERKAKMIWDTLQRIRVGAEVDEIAWGTSQERIPRRRELVEGTLEATEEEYVTPPQSPEHIAERASIIAIRRTPQEIQINKEIALARRALSQPLESTEGTEIRNLFEEFERSETSILRSNTQVRPSVDQCIAVYKQVTSDFIGREGTPPINLLAYRCPTPTVTYIPGRIGEPGITIRHSPQKSGTAELLPVVIAEGSCSHDTPTSRRSPNTLTHIGVKGCSLGRSELLSLTTSVLCQHLHQLWKHLSSVEQRQPTWPRERRRVKVAAFRLFRSDVHVMPGGQHPINLPVSHYHDRDNTLHILDKEVILTLRTEAYVLFLTIWEKADEWWLERASAIFSYEEYKLLDLEILAHDVIRHPIQKEEAHDW